MPRRPEDILQAIEKNEARRNLGQLRIFLGMCPGVGKTYSMLKAAREQLQRGVRVSVGVVETHGRKDTQELLTGLDVFPKKEIDYKGTKLLEMDLDKILVEKPSLVLVDELAHTNAPGSRHAKRYQDVEELLRAGIDVFSTLNIQHIESRNDQVAQITGIQVRETVPDSFLENATQIELVDLSPQELLHRLHEGKVYLGDRAVTAAQNFFQEEHLSALRELALRFTAEKVDQDLQTQMAVKGIEGPWQTNERLLVAVSYSPYSARLIRATRRMAYNLESPWIALYVDTGELLNVEDKENLQKNLSLARELGAELVTIADTDVANAIQKICEEKNVTQIVMGRPDRRFFRDMVSRGTLLDQLVRTTSKIDVHVIRAPRKPSYKGFYLQFPAATSGFFSYYHTAWFLTGVSLFSYALHPYVGYRALGSVFLLAILGVATVASRGPILFAATISAVVWDYFFIPPAFTFFISSWEDWMMVISFFVTGTVAGLLTSRIRRQEKILEMRESRSRILYEFVKKLSDAKTLVQIQSVLILTVDRVFQASCTIFFVERDGKLDWSKAFGPKLDEKDLAVAQWAFENNSNAGWSTQTLAGSKCLCIPMVGNSGPVGVLSFQPAEGKKDFPIDEESFLGTVLKQAAIAFERFRFSEAAQMAKIYEASETLHQTLLNSVSHELRTPITALIGTSSALRDEKTFSDSKARAALTEELVHSAHRLDRVVENLLDLTRLQKGSLQLKKEWFDLSDLLNEVKSDLNDELIGRRLDVVRDDGVLVEGDFQLLSHAVNQIVLNAIRYSDPSSRIEIEILKEHGRTRVLVRDEGKGIPEGMETQIFDKFFRVPGTPAGGLGLGLTIASNIIELHGGKISARNRSDKLGSIFEIELPLKTAPKELEEAIR